MKNLLLKLMLAIVLCFSMMGCASTSPHEFDKKSFMKRMKRNEIVELNEYQKQIVARITFYHNYEDRYGSRVSTGKRAVQGITVAAHPDFKLGTQVMIPELQPIIGSYKFTVQDRGTAVTRKRASRGKEYVFDVYVRAKNRRDGEHLVKQFSSRLGDYAVVYFKG